MQWPLLRRPLSWLLLLGRGPDAAHPRAAQASASSSAFPAPRLTYPHTTLPTRLASLPWASSPNPGLTHSHLHSDSWQAQTAESPHRLHPSISQLTEPSWARCSGPTALGSTLGPGSCVYSQTPSSATFKILPNLTASPTGHLLLCSGPPPPLPGAFYHCLGQPALPPAVSLEPRPLVTLP